MLPLKGAAFKSRQFHKMPDSLIFRLEWHSSQRGPKYLSNMNPYIRPLCLLCVQRVCNVAEMFLRAAKELKRRKKCL